MRLPAELLFKQETSLGKPLISDTALRGMHRAMQHIAAEKRSADVVATLSRADRAALQDEPEAVLAALFSQLHRRDTVVAQGTNPLALTAVDSWFPHTGAPILHQLQIGAEECAAVGAGLALRIRDRAAMPSDTYAGRRPVVVALLRGVPPLASVLQLMEHHELALVLVLSGDPESRAQAQRRLQSSSVPTLPVDRADAVAVCRVVQECLLRARNGWGGAVIHAARVPGTGDPLSLLQQHLRKRGLLDGTNREQTWHE